MSKLKIIRSEISCKVIYFNEPKYNLNTPYREYESEAWSIEEKQYLISSILNGYDIGPIYIYNEHKNPFSEPNIISKHIIDGSERIKAIWQFMNNKFTTWDERDTFTFELSDGKTYDDYMNKTFAVLKQIDPDIIDRFENHLVNATFIECDNIDILKDMVNRLEM